jgi:hypothetical protein
MPRKNLDTSKKKSKVPAKKDTQPREKKIDESELIDEKDEYESYPYVPGKKYFQDDF